MNHKLAAPTPPLGWNSWDCYGAAVTEEEIRGNAEYMAEHLFSGTSLMQTLPNTGRSFHS